MDRQRKNFKPVGGNLTPVSGLLFLRNQNSVPVVRVDFSNVHTHNFHQLLDLYNEKAFNIYQAILTLHEKQLTQLNYYYILP